jgi:hypothetical protein
VRVLRINSKGSISFLKIFNIKKVHFTKYQNKKNKIKGIELIGPEVQA